MENRDFIINEKYMNPDSIETAITLLTHYISSVSRGKDPLISYGELCKKISFHPSPRCVDVYLGDLSYACKDNGLPPISAIVVNNDKRLCGDGFFKAYCTSTLKNEEKMKTWVEIISKIVNYPNWNDVLEAYKKLA